MWYDGSVILIIVNSYREAGEYAISAKDNQDSYGSYNVIIQKYTRTYLRGGGFRFFFEKWRKRDRKKKKGMLGWGTS